MLKVKKVHPDATLPTVAHPGEDLGYDLYAVENVRLQPNTPTRVHTGIIAYEEKTLGVLVELPVKTAENTIIDNIILSELTQGESLRQQRFGLILKDRSSMAAKGITLSAGVIDSGYRGELFVVLTSARGDVYTVQKGDKIAQAIPVPVDTDGVEEVEELEDSARGEKGFGSSGK